MMWSTSLKRPRPTSSRQLSSIFSVPADLVPERDEVEAKITLKNDLVPPRPDLVPNQGRTSTVTSSLVPLFIGDEDEVEVRA